ncbi:uncharacterized protein LOC125238434 [Leguminivora glycinivorella]|uniref:uncharacterized protein LOC125238434 n=1 Tax=Leguminivora glycinivorella TaxID=1035111 RepID=UPI00200BC36E|nr:uncharacterized protein LOC125238434 [Leguminivora glycinivorella]
MLYKIVAVSIFLGLVCADPLPEISSPSSKEMSLLSTLIHGESQDQSSELARIEPTLISDLINAVIGYKSSALLIAVDVIEWLVSKSVIIVIGAILTVGFCKLTDKCNWDWEQYVPLEQFRSLATPERLARAEKFFVTAVEKYAEKKSHRSLNTL